MVKKLYGIISKKQVFSKDSRVNKNKLSDFIVNPFGYLDNIDVELLVEFIWLLYIRSKESGTLHQISTLAERQSTPESEIVELVTNGFDAQTDKPVGKFGAGFFSAFPRDGEKLEISSSYIKAVIIKKYGEYFVRFGEIKESKSSSENLKKLFVTLLEKIKITFNKDLSDLDDLSERLKVDSIGTTIKKTFPKGLFTEQLVDSYIKVLKDRFERFPGKLIIKNDLPGSVVTIGTLDRPVVVVTFGEDCFTVRDFSTTPINVLIFLQFMINPASSTKVQKKKIKKTEQSDDGFRLLELEEKPDQPGCLYMTTEGGLLVTKIPFGSTAYPNRSFELSLSSSIDVNLSRTGFVYTTSFVDYLLKIFERKKDLESFVIDFAFIVDLLAKQNIDKTSDVYTRFQNLLQRIATTIDGFKSYKFYPDHSNGIYLKQSNTDIALPPDVYLRLEEKQIGQIYTAGEEFEIKKSQGAELRLVKDLPVAFTIVGTTIYWNQEIFEHYIKTNHGLELINMAMKSIDTGYVSPGKITGKQKERVLVEIRRKKPSDDGSGESKYSKSDPDNTVKSKEEKTKDLQKDNASKQEQFDDIRLLSTEIEKILSLKNEQIKKILEREILKKRLWSWPCKTLFNTS